MSEIWLLSLVERYPDRTALARRARDGLFEALARLEDRGLLRRERDRFRLTRRGRNELALAHSLIQLLMQRHRRF